VSVRVEARLWLAQRVSAMVLALAVVVHIATVVHAVRGGLSAAEIIARVQGNDLWLVFYLVFVAAAAVHAPIGMRTVLHEHTALPAGVIGALASILALALAAAGVTAVWALYAYPGP